MGWCVVTIGTGAPVRSLCSVPDTPESMNGAQKRSAVTPLRTPGAGRAWRQHGRGTGPAQSGSLHLSHDLRDLTPALHDAPCTPRRWPRCLRPRRRRLRLGRQPLPPRPRRDLLRQRLRGGPGDDVGRDRRHRRHRLGQHLHERPRHDRHLDGRHRHRLGPGDDVRRGHPAHRRDGPAVGVRPGPVRPQHHRGAERHRHDGRGGLRRQRRLLRVPGHGHRHPQRHRLPQRGGARRAGLLP